MYRWALKNQVGLRAHFVFVGDDTPPDFDRLVAGRCLTVRPDEVEELVHLDSGGPDSCDVARGLAERRRTDLERRIRDLQRMHDSLADLVATCDLPRADRSCALLAAIGPHTEATR